MEPYKPELTDEQKQTELIDLISEEQEEKFKQIPKQLYGMNACNWISVKDKLPEFDLEVLTYSSTWNAFDICIFVECTEDWEKRKYSANGVFVTSDDVAIYPQYWMFLPQAPHVDGEVRVKK